MTSAEELVYARGELSVERIETEIARFWQDFEANNSELASELHAAAIDKTALANVDQKKAVTVHAHGSGADQTLVLIVVALAPSANSMLKDLWQTIMLPRIRRRWGEDAVGEEKRGKD